MQKYIGVSLPRQLIAKVDAKKEKFSFCSRAEFVKQAIRNELRRLEGLHEL